MNEWEKKLKDPPKSYRPLPFWAWNERLNTEESARQIEEMDSAGLGGFFMHARGGLETEYMGEEWMDNVRCSLEEGKKRGMEVWGYDENGWPSGFGAGAVNGLGEAYQQKYLRVETTETPQHTPRTIINLPYEGKNRHFFYEVNPFYVDTMDRRVIAKFLETIHEQYKQKLTREEFSALDGFFTDEPQVSRAGIPWSPVLPEEYRRLYGEALEPRLTALFYDTADSAQVRFRFWKLVRDLFTEAYMHQIYDWCCENGTKLTGHMVLEETMETQLTCNGACMPSYEFMHMPGMDWLGRVIGSSTTPVQVASVAAQTGKKAVVSETFALCGWDVSFEELKWVAEWQMVRGINRLCQHLQGYSLRGIRKRDYPATLYFQEPWWKEYKALNDYFSRVGMLLAEGKIAFRTLVIHPMSSGWLCFNNGDNGRLRELDDRFARLLTALDEAQVPYHLGDERIMARHGAAEGSRLRVGEQSYSVVIVPDALTLSAETAALLEQYRANGGLLLFSGVIPTMIDGVPEDRAARLAAGCPSYADPAALAAAVPDSARPLRLTGAVGGVASTVRLFPQDGTTVYYIVNSSAQERTFTARFAGGSAGRLEDLTGDIRPIVYTAQNGRIETEITLPAMGSVLLFAYADDRLQPAAPEAARRPINGQLAADWELAETDLNTLTLDYCDYYFDGRLVGQNRHISNLQEEACRLERPVDVETVFRFQVKTLPETPVWLVLETPEKFRIRLNGQEVPYTDDGYYRDRSFRKIPIAGRLVPGENELRLTVHFTQRDSIYRNIRDSQVFESEKNMLTYDTEIEAVYLLGDFGVETDGRFETLERRALRYDGGFALTARPHTLHAGDITTQGFPFFAGRMVWRQTVRLSPEDCIGRSLLFAGRCDTVTRVRVNGREAGTVLWQPYAVPLDGLLQPGDNVIEVEVIGNLRNLLGPHHLASGESYFVCPQSFFENSPIWCGGHNDDWDDRYCFVQHGLFV